jgi:hypothetical protein
METRYFYSTDGTDAHGPVTVPVLRQLLQDKTISEASYLCQEGEATWQRLDPNFLRPIPLLQPVKPLSGPPPFSPPPYVHTPEAIARAEAFSRNDWEEPGPLPMVLKVIGWIVALGGSVVLAWLGRIAHPDAPQSVSYQLGAFTGALIFLGLIPYLISLPFKDLTRAIVRLVAILGLTFLILLGKLSPMARFDATANAMTDKVKAEARKEIAAKGYYGGDTKEAEQNIQALKDQATGNSESARISRDMLTLTQTLLAKVKVSDDAEATCVFDPGSITTLDDVTQRRTAINKLRDDQADVLTFLQDYDVHCSDALTHENFDATTVSATIAGARKGGHIDQLISLWQLRMKLTDDHLARLDFLQQKWGTWQARDGKILFQDDTSLAAYNVYVAALKKDVQQMGDVQKQIFQ